MHEKLQEFQAVLTECLDLFSPKLRPTVTIQEDYEPHNGPGMPVQAIIIGNKWACFVQMWGGKGNYMPEVRVEEINPEDTPMNKKREDPSAVSGGPNPYSSVGLLMQVIVSDYMWPLHRAYHKKLWPK